MAESRINLTALQQRDPYITEIVATASQVALYSFSSQANQWKRTSVEGCLFIYQRSASPVTGFMILNRLGLNNLVEPITKDLEFQHQDPFLLYRNAKSIYGIWFYDKDECRRLGDLLQRYLHKVIDKQSNTKESSPTLRRRGSKGEDMHDPTKGQGQGLVAPSQVDIMQMLSRAQHEYNTHSKVPSGNGRSQIEPKPMIDNPNASATKTNNIIRPMPVKMPDNDQAPSGSDELLNPTTPGTAPISLDALFRTASLQQQSGSMFPQPDLPQVPKPPALGRSVPIPVPTVQAGSMSGSRELVVEDGALPPLLKHIMSTGSMVEDIERGPPRAIDASTLRHSTSEDKLSPFLGVVPDLTQPPPSHPAYRGPSPKATVNRGLSPMSTTNKDSPPQVTNNPKVSKPSFSLGPGGQSVLTPASSAAQIISGNLISQFTSGGEPSDRTSQAPTAKVGATVGARVPSRGTGDNLLCSAGRQESSPVGAKVGSLLTPADLVQSSSTSSGTSSSHLDKSDINLAAAAASLSTELLTPMAFTTSMVRKTPPVSQTSAEDRSRDSSSDNLPIAALTKEQLQQSLLYLIKNDSNFISTLHEAYLKSIQELSGQKT